jgi:exopolysaccharide biosynthesis polyprenyl glycosylphosphotransferase
LIRLFNRYWSLPAFLSLGVEAPLLFLSVYAGTWIRLVLLTNGRHTPEKVLAVDGLVFATVGLLSLYLNGLYDFAEQISTRILFVRLLRALTLASVALWALYFLIPELQIGRGVFVLSILLAGATVILWRVILRYVVLSDSFAERVLIIGSGEKAIELAREVLHRRHLGYRVVGFLDDDPALQGVSLLNPRVIGTTRQCRDLALAHGVTRVVVAPGDSRGSVSMDALLSCKTSGIRVQEGSSYYEQLTGKIMVEGLRKSWLVFSDGFVVSPGVLFGKRLLDLLAAGTALLLAAPVMALVALAVRLDSPGPIFFRQERVGRGGRPFTVWKFRSMRPDAEAEGARWAVTGDPRVTRIGRFIRTTRLDELPQLWNVLVGDMSLVGPRPCMPSQAELVEARRRLGVFAVRPGITGLAQVRGIDMSDANRLAEVDAEYVRSQSLPGDLRLIMATLRGQGVGVDQVVRHNT